MVFQFETVRITTVLDVMIMMHVVFTACFILSTLQLTHSLRSFNRLVGASNRLLLNRTVKPTQRPVAITTSTTLNSNNNNNDMSGIEDDDEPMIRIGHGFDIHRLVSGKKLVIGGVQIPHPLGADAHSDGDVIYHRFVLV